MNWEKTGTRINANGERIVTYEFMDMKIQSRSRASRRTISPSGTTLK